MGYRGERAAGRLAGRAPGDRVASGSCGRKESLAAQAQRRGYAE
ncbi:MAG: hypothetical protein M5R40_20540 [Anaerolineae bacterium]|nr:hypothetical protein [Anaerolineae bacterium]